MTGRGRGYCAGFDRPGCNDSRTGRGRGGWGARNMYRATGVPGWARFGGRRFVGGAPAYGAYVPTPPAPEPASGDEAKALKAQADYLADALQEIKARLADLEQGSS